jgi:predicted alpha/beta-hydrolase family hydrolase
VSAAEKVTLAVGERRVSGLLLRPDSGARTLLVLGHGAGAGMTHPFLESMAALLAARGVATLRYQFPYFEAGSRRPDPRPVLLATVRAAVAMGAARSEGLPLLAGGKSMGGRMTSLAAAEAPLAAARGIVFLGFPLHPAGRPGEAPERSAHLARVALPMLFLQGTRDRLADPELVRPLCAELGARAELHEVAEADHSFRVPRSTGRSDGDVLLELAEAVRAFAERVGGAA